MKNFLRNTIIYGLTPAAVTLSLLAYGWAVLAGGNIETSLLIATVLTLALTMAAERWMPFNTQWNKTAQDSRTDYTSFAVLAGLVQPLLKWLSPIAVVTVYALLGLQPAASFAQWGLVEQILLATLVAELGKYAVHRWHHASPRLWWLHALHHGSTRLYSINGFRVHPLEYALKHSVSLLLLMMLGMPAEALLGYVALTQPVQILQHANLPLRHGWLNYIFSTNELHRWHHSRNLHEANSNFGSAIVLWDIVFGTYLPAAQKDTQEAHAAIGLFATTRYPATRSFFAQLASMFSPQCCKPS